jgi:hypothetical protein
MLLSQGHSGSQIVAPCMYIQYTKGSDGRSVKLLLVFASAVIPGFSLFEVHDQDFYSLLDMHVLEMGLPLRRGEGLIFLCRRYVGCTVLSARVYPRCHGVQVTTDSVRPLSLHCTK